MIIEFQPGLYSQQRTVLTGMDKLFNAWNMTVVVGLLINKIRLTMFMTDKKTEIMCLTDKQTKNIFITDGLTTNMGTFENA